MPKSKIARLALILVTVLFVAAGLSRISFNIDILKLLPTHLPQVEGLGIFLKNFSLPNELIVTINAPDSETAEGTATALAEKFRARPDLVAKAVSEPPWEKNPGGIAELLAVLLLNQPPAEIQALAARLSPGNAATTAAATLEKLNDSLSPQEVALLSYDPYGLAGTLANSGLLSSASQSEFSSADGSFRVVYVNAAQTFKNYKDTIVWVSEIKKLAREANPNPNVKLGFTGEPSFVADISSTMEWDMSSSGFVTLAIISIIFWGCYRRARPLFDLQLMLALIFAISLAAAGLFLKQLTVIGVGFASIMIGLSVDYGYLIYQKSLRHTGTLRELQMACLQNIMWTAGTTAAAFFALNFSSLPGLSQLGNLVGIGVIVGAAIMLLVFAPITMKWKKITPRETLLERLMASPKFIQRASWMTAALVLSLVSVLFFKGLPTVDSTSKSLRPRHSEAYDALDLLSSKLTDDTNLLSLVVTGASEEEVHQKLKIAERKLRESQAKGDVESFRSPLPLWPAPDHQRINLTLLQPFAQEIPRLKQTVLDAGFTEESFLLTSRVFQQIAQWKNTPIWPENEASRWIYRRLASRNDGQFIAMGLVTPVDGRQDAAVAAVQSPGVWLVSWSQLGAELQRVIPGEFARLILSLLGIILFLLFFAFGGIRDLLVLVVTLGLVFLALMGAMSLLGMQWNFFNLAAILLLLGTGIDYAILFLLTLKRNGGDIPAARQSLGLVIFLCAGSAAAGFGTISWANNLGLASLGQTCALGLAIDALVSVFLLPQIWRLSRGLK